MRTLTLHILLLLVPLLVYAEWQTIEPMPTAREGVAVATLNGKIYVIGGKNQAGYTALGLVEIYDTERQEWTTGQSLIYPRFLAAAAAHDGKIFLFGGRNGSDLVQEIEMLDPDVGAWVYVDEMMPRREGLTATTRGDSILVIAGKMQMMYSSHTSVFDPVNMLWVDNNMGSCPQARAGHGAAMVDNEIHIIGGVYFGMLSNTSKLNGNAWSNELELPAPRGNTSSAAIDDNIFLIAGNTGTGVTNGVYRYSVTNNVWSDFEPITEPRENHGVVELNNVIYVIGGGREGVPQREFLSSVEIYDFNTGVSSPSKDRTELMTFEISNHPNPFSSQTSIFITSVNIQTLNQPVIIYNLLGQEVMRWNYPSWNGAQTVLQWNGIDSDGNLLPAGVYFIRIDAGEFNNTKKISIVR